MCGHRRVVLAVRVRVAEAGTSPTAGSALLAGEPGMRCWKCMDLILGLFHPDLVTTIKSRTGACPGGCAACDRGGKILTDPSVN